MKRLLFCLVAVAMVMAFVVPCYSAEMKINGINRLMAFLGFGAFNTKKITGQDTIDFVKYRQMIAAGHAMDDELYEAVLGKPQQ